MEYLNAVFHETLRLTPPGAFGTIRIAGEDFQLGGATIRKGTFLNVRFLSVNPSQSSRAELMRPKLKRARCIVHAGCCLGTSHLLRSCASRWQAPSGEK